MKTQNLKTHVQAYTGKNLDRWLAEHVMGWKLTKRDMPRDGEFLYNEHIDRVQIRIFKRTIVTWSPMKYGAQAFAVLDVLVKSRKSHIEISYWPNFGRKKYSVSGMAGATLREAICKFARAVYEGKI